MFTLQLVSGVFKREVLAAVKGRGEKFLQAVAICISHARICSNQRYPGELMASVCTLLLVLSEKDHIVTGVTWGSQFGPWAIGSSLRQRSFTGSGAGLQSETAGAEDSISTLHI